MIKYIHLILLLLLLIAACKPKEHPAQNLVDITTVNSHIILDIRYATDNNFLSEAVYPAPRCFVLRAVAGKLDSIQKELENSGYGLKIFDGYRPYSVTQKMWEILPDERYVANPAKGSRHNRGAAVDLTLVDSSGNELAMPTEFDDFSEKAGHDYQDLPQYIKDNRTILRNIMEKYGFVAYINEWWHYDIADYQRGCTTQQQQAAPAHHRPFPDVRLVSLLDTH